MAEFTYLDSDVLRIKRTDAPNMWEGFDANVRPGKSVYYFDDFFTYRETDYTLTTTELGAGSATEVITDEHGGVLLITNDAADNDLDSFQLTGESILPASGRTCYFEMRMKKSDATQSDWLVGFSITDTSPLGSTSGYFFQKDDGDTQVDLWVNGSTTLNIATDDTSYHKYGIKIIGLNTVEFWIDDVKKASLPFTGTATEVRPTFHIQNGEAVAKTMSVDYLAVAATR